MAGTNPYGLSEATRSDYLALYFLSKFASSAYILRQEDAGIDLQCCLCGQKEIAVLSQTEFGVQIKPSGLQALRYGGKDRPDAPWKDREIRWLFHQKMPLFICSSDVKNDEISLYSVNKIWWFRARNTLPFCVSLKPNETHRELDFSKDTFFDSIKVDSEGDGMIWNVPIGLPLVTVKLGDLQNVQFIKDIGNLVESVCKIEMINIFNSNYTIPVYLEITGWNTNDPGSVRYLPRMLRHKPDSDSVKNTCSAMYPAVIGLMDALREPAFKDELGDLKGPDSVR